MRTLAFDGRMGASGDMILAALLAAGADRDALAPVESTLPIRYEVGETTRNGITATAVDVLRTDDAGDDDIDDSGDAGDTHDHHEPEQGHDHTHDHSHGHHEPEQGHDHSHGHHEPEQGHDHSHDHSHDHTHDHHRDHGGDEDEAASAGRHAEGHGPHRSYAEVVSIVESMDLDAAVETEAKAIFRLLGEGEAAVHGTDLESTHFHEVGADDAIADVVGACLLLADLGVDRVVTTPLSTGGGTVDIAHGVYPVPTPAVVEIASRADWSLRGGPVAAELLTPTGAAVLAHVADGVEYLPPLRLERSGYGAGGYSFPSHPNVLRVLVGDGGGGLVRDDITVLETNLDDATPEVLGGLQERLVEAGARDVTVLPATMKKSRPGHLVKVVVKPADAARVAHRLAVETGTLGVREHGVSHRWIAERHFETVTVDAGGRRHEVTVKVASDTEDDVYDVSAEYDDAAAVARETDTPVREVVRRAEAAYEQRRRDDTDGN